MIMLLVSILLILQKDKGILHIINVSLFYFLALLFSLFYPRLFHKKHNMGKLVLQTHLPSNGIFKKTFDKLAQTGVGFTFSLQTGLKKKTASNAFYLFHPRQNTRNEPLVQQ